MPKSPSSDRELRQRLQLAWDAVLNKKALDPVCLDVRGLAGFTDFFIICHGNNPAQIQALADEVQRSMELNAGLRPLQMEGYRHAQWIVLDYGGLVVHIFAAGARNFYGLERLWQKAPQFDMEANQQFLQQPGKAVARKTAVKSPRATTAASKPVRAPAAQSSEPEKPRRRSPLAAQAAKAARPRKLGVKRKAQSKKSGK